MTRKQDDPVTLAEALGALVAAANRAGVDPDVARREGECLAATIAEPARGAFVDWSEQTGRGRSADDFTDAASRGRRYRSAPTPSMSGLSLAGSAHAPAYARALSDVALAACSLGEENPRTVGNAATAAAAQLGEATSRSGGPPEDPADREPVPDVSDHFLGQLLEQLGSVQRRISDLDLTGLDPHGPGAFPGLSGTTPADAMPSEAGPGETGEATDRRPTGQAAPDPQPPVPAEETEPEPEAKSVEELLAELDALVGLTEVKAEIHRQAAILRVEGLRQDAGLGSPTITRHMIFNGNPGTGKTTVARLVAGIYRALGLLSKGQLVEVDRSELVAGYLGQTAMKTADVVKSAEGGVLFIDEAYSLAGDQYGTEAVDTLVKEMEDKRDDLVIIVAGYPLPMEVFIAQNPGLESRFRTRIDFPDYTDDELVAIFEILARSAEYDADGQVLGRLREILGTVQRGPTFGNARYVRNLLEAAIGRHAWRLREVERPDLGQLRTLLPEDLDPVVPDGPAEAVDLDLYVPTAPAHEAVPETVHEAGDEQDPPAAEERP